MSAHEILAQHLWRGEILGCECRWNWPDERTYFCGEEDRISRAHVEHQLDALKDAGYAVVELPELDPESGIWAEPNSPFGPRVCRGTKGDSFTYWPPEFARSLALALLAAANAAEVTQ